MCLLDLAQVNPLHFKISSFFILNKNTYSLQWAVTLYIGHSSPQPLKKSITYRLTDNVEQLCKPVYYLLQGETNEILFTPYPTLSVSYRRNVCVYPDRMHYAIIFYHMIWLQ